MIKKYFKLNNNLAEPKRGMPNYNPCSKYEYTNKVLLHNMNYITRRAVMDGTMNEATWGLGRYMGECGGHLMGKKVPKGGQTTFLMDIHRRYPRASIHRHKLQNPKTRPDGFSYQGPAKVVDIVKPIDGLIDGTDPAYTETVIPNTTDVWKHPNNKIYQLPPHITADNHFSGDNTIQLWEVRGIDSLSLATETSISIEKKSKQGIRWQRQCDMRPVLLIFLGDIWSIF